jgi:hypothetical protein
MPSTLRLRDYSAEELRALARRSRDVNESRRLLSLPQYGTGWIEGRRPRSAGWIARLCATYRPRRAS